MLYIIRFQSKLGNPNNPRAQAQYYIGHCAEDRLGDRYFLHIKGAGAAITKACVERGIPMEVIAILPGGTRHDERMLKRRKYAPRFVERLLTTGVEGWVVMSNAYDHWELPLVA